MEGVLLVDDINRLPSGDTKSFTWRAEIPIAINTTFDVIRLAG